MKIQHDVLELIRENVEEHEQTIDHNEPRDFTDKVKRLTFAGNGTVKFDLIHVRLSLRSARLLIPHLASMERAAG